MWKSVCKKLKGEQNGIIFVERQAPILRVFRILFHIFNILSTFAYYKKFTDLALIINFNLP